MPSIFTRIINGEIPCYKIYEDDKTLAFLDIHPETKGHTLVIPKNEVDKITLWKVVGTDVPHAHVHLEPFDETWHYGREVELTPEEFEEIRQKLELK